MRLQRLYITGFGGLREIILDLSGGITVLLGANEAGKSTVLHCLSQVLMGKPTQRSSFQDFTPWDGGPFAAALEFTNEDALYRLTRRFDESGTRAVALHRLREDGSEQLVTQEAGEVRKWVANALGTADDRIFYRVFCFTQADLTPLDNFAGLREHLERAVSGADVAVAAAVGRIDERLAIHRRGLNQPALQQNWGQLKRAEDARRDWEARLHEAKRQQRRLAEAREAAAALQRRIAEATSRVTEITGLLEQERRRRDLHTRLADMRTAWANVEGERERVERLQADRDRLQGALQHLPPAFADQTAIRARLLAARQGGASPWLGWMLIALGIILAGIITAFSDNLFSLLVAVIGIALGAPIIARAGRQTRAISRLRSELGVENLTSAEHRLEEAERLRHELDATDLALTAVTDVRQLAERRRTLTLDIAMLEEQLAGIPGMPLTAEEAHRLTQEQQSLQAALPGLQEQERAITRELAVLEESERDLIDLEDGVAYWREQEARAKEEEQTLLLARELLLQAGQQAHSRFADPLAGNIGPLFAHMTGERYPSVRVQGDAKSFQVHPLDTDGTPIPPDQLSQGTRDQFILAVRLALGQVIAGPQGSPIFLLDDPFLHFDADRRREALAMLTDLSTRAQIILATHDESILPSLPDAQILRMSPQN